MMILSVNFIGNSEYYINEGDNNNKVMEIRKPLTYNIPAIKTEKEKKARR